ncbi:MULTISPECIES: BREX system Lon protease-like protein BrxL [Actinomyces]|uniref:BREX system Lon protease-like protein BrxL n=1 Tax=Actinomyces respiraculi TaxID=2744574 RepID=A0A7T0PWJ2_9ACTO|nr:MULTISPECIES: BREX system Lon protease-like protein BrxL [Actinomyces]QPL04895.1 BREX system Lon protease-like protein BrxL [Actinomyces respiraculi]
MTTSQPSAPEPGSRETPCAGQDPTAYTPSDLDRKIAAAFPGVVVRKDLVKAVKGNAIVPTYVLEYLLGQYAATDDEATIRTGIEQVRSILRDHYVHRGENRLIQSRIREKGRHRIIDKVSVSLNERQDIYEAEFSNLGISRVEIGADMVREHPKLLTGGVWCICDIVYAHSGDPKEVPWRLHSLKPIQLSRLDLTSYTDTREQFTTQEWTDLLIQSIGFNPEMLGERTKLLHLVRLIPFVERNYNLIELGPKGTGKSHIYSEFSPHGMLISGGEVTVPKLFVNNANGRIGLVGYWDCVAFDEFAGRKKRADRALVDIMKNYMANKSFSRGVETLGAQASMVFVGNTAHTVPYMLKNSDLFDELPEQYHDPAFLDRIHSYVPGWEFEQIRGEMFSTGYGFVVDYLAEVLKSQRDLDYSDRYQEYVSLSEDISTRDRDGIHKTFSGLMKLIHPSGRAGADEIEALLRVAVEGRKRVKDQLLRIDGTMTPVRFGYSTGQGWRAVSTVEEEEYPELYHRDGAGDHDGTVENARAREAGSSRGAASPEGDGVRREPRRTAPELREGSFSFTEGRRGFSYDRFFGPYLRGATRIEIIDPYIRQPHQARNLTEFLETVAKVTDRTKEVAVHLITKPDTTAEHARKQVENLEAIKNNTRVAGIAFDYAFNDTIHDRSITADTGWLIVLGRGLDVFQPFDTSWFDLRLRQQIYRQVKEFTITYVRRGDRA